MDVEHLVVDARNAGLPATAPKRPLGGRVATEGGGTVLSGARVLETAPAGETPNGWTFTVKNEGSYSIHEYAGCCARTCDRGLSRERGDVAGFDGGDRSAP